MIAHPTTEQILLDCCQELREGVMPDVANETTIVRLAMIEQVLRNAAIRCAHEIAWMSEEIPAIVTHARAVLDVASDDGLAHAMRHLADADTEQLHLDAVADRYRRAGEVLAAAVEITVTEELSELRRQGEQLLEQRLARERETMAGWTPTGR